MNAYHFVNQMLPFQTSIVNRNAYVDLWRRLRKRFPKVIACVLMPDHLHLIVMTSKPARVKWNLGVELRAWTQRFYPGQNVWARIPDPKSIPDFLHMKRQIRYVHLNPCRERLVSDPFQWEWSTHRDVSDCVVNPWPDFEWLQNCFRSQRARLGEVMHAYISADPSVSVTGSPMIQPYRDSVPIAVDTSQILKAAAVVRREEVKLMRGEQRTLAVHVAKRLKLQPDPKKLGMDQRTWNRILEKPTDSAPTDSAPTDTAPLDTAPLDTAIDEASIQAVLRILTNPRLR